MKFSATAALLSISAVSASPLLRARQQTCQIHKPDGFITFDVSLLNSNFNFTTLTPGNSFDVSRTTITGAQFSNLAGGNGPCALKFFFNSPNDFASAAGTSGQINVIQINPDLPSAEDIAKSAFLLGTVNIRPNDPDNFPRVFEVNSPACPASGKMVVGFVASLDDGTHVTFQQRDYKGVFVFKGDCFGIPQTSQFV